MKAGLSMWSRVQEGSWCCGLIVQHYRGTMVESHRKGSDVISLPSFTLTMLWNLIRLVSLHCQWWNVTNCIFYQYNFDVPVLYLCISMYIHINLLDQKREYPVQLSVSMSVVDFPSAARSHTPLNLLAVRPHSHNRCMCPLFQTPGVTSLLLEPVWHRLNLHTFPIHATLLMM